MSKILIDCFKVVHWMNARKVTPTHVAKITHFDKKLITDFFVNPTMSLKLDAVKTLTAALDVPISALVQEINLPKNGYIFQSSNDLYKTCRPISRDGIHFYNYYTLPSPSKFVKPVILDILCPSNRDPKLNNGHLEPAITINLGPGDIYGKWDKFKSKTSWKLLKSNTTPNDCSWIVGDSYVEPSYCPHTYSLATQQPARILSYTVKYHLEEVFNTYNCWDNACYNNFKGSFKKKSIGCFILRKQMERHCHTVKSLSLSSQVSENLINNFLNGNSNSLTINKLKVISKIIGIDYRILLPNNSLGDKLGKIHMNRTESISTIRKYKNYEVASMANSTNIPDLSGIFLRSSKNKFTELDLSFFGNTHYLITEGKFNFHINDFKGDNVKIALSKNDSIWVAPYKKHAFSGKGALIKMSNGESDSYIDYIELGNCYKPERAMKRGYKDLKSWGYTN